MKLDILNKVPLGIQKASPEIFVGAGLGLMVCSTVFACKSTLKAHEILEKRDADIAHCKELREAVVSGKYDDVTEETYSEKMFRKDVYIAYSKSFMDFIKLYWKSLACGTAGALSILYGHQILNGRNLAAVASCEAIKKGYSEYRQRVIDELGEEADKRFRYGIQKKDIEVEEEKEDGTTKKKKLKDAPVIEGYSENAKFFDASSPYWVKSPEYNLLFLRERQEYANMQLQKRGHLFLNEVYDILGIPRTKRGAVEGWVYKHKDGTTGFVDFGIYELYREAARDFVNGYENVILLDFNVDGDILNAL